MLRQRTFTADCRARNRCCRIAVSELFGQPYRFFSTMRVAKKLIDIHQARAGYNPFVAHMPKPSCQKPKQFDFEFCARCEVRVAAFTSKNVVRLSIPVKPGFP